MTAVTVDGRIVALFQSEESAQEYVAQHAEAMRERMKLVPTPASPFPKKDYLHDAK